MALRGGTRRKVKRDTVMKNINQKMNPLGCVKCTESSISLSFADFAKVHTLMG